MEYSDSVVKGNEGKIKKIMNDLNRSSRYLKPLHDAIEKDFEFLQGKQWEDDDKETLRKVGVKALTINKLKPIQRLLTGIERQSKSDFIAFPDGDEDGIVADIATKLLKNVSKKSSADRILSECFKRGSACGVDFIEPYIDYSQNLINGVMKLKNISPLNVFFDPDAVEYDLSDGKFLIKIVKDLSKEDLEVLFPSKTKVIEGIANGKINIDVVGAGTEHIQGRDYPGLNSATGHNDDVSEKRYDLIVYQYKMMVNKYYIVDSLLETVIPVENKESAVDYISAHEGSKLIDKKNEEIRICYVCGDEILEDEVSWAYPKWNKYTILPYFAEWLTIGVKRSDLNIQGFIRGLIDLQEEYNKRRTQELRHLNSSVNSGIMYPKGSLSEQEKDKIKKYGSSPGIAIEYEGSIGKPERIPPMPLSTAHAQLAIENAQDLKEASGVNPDLLANSDNDQSGRAILLKQKQGLVMIQELLDNYSDTKKNLGKFLLSQLGEIYTVETALKVVGSSFIEKYQEFKKPVIDPNTNMPVMNENTGELETEIDQEIVNTLFNEVLSNDEIGNYDVSIGEGAYSETLKMSNYVTLQDMISKGLPIPPEILVSESMLPEGVKQKINSSIEKAIINAQQAQNVPLQ